MTAKILRILVLLISATTIGQNVTISGNITDNVSKQPLPGVNIIIKNTAKGVVSDFDGNFTITDVPMNAVLVFSYIGFVNQEITVKNSKAMNVVMAEDAQALNEVVVIGYGTQKIRDLTGSVGIVSSKTLDDLKPVKVEQALQGTVSGVNVTSQSGAPGAGLDIRIRGVATNGENGPTVIIDGYVGDLSILNPNDIETITVLKDAQAAIYGTIGANGVILVTTKSGKQNEKPKVSYNTYVGFQESSRNLPLLNSTEYAILLNETYASTGLPLPYPNISGLGEGTDWQDEVLKEAVPIISHDISILGGSEKIKYAFSGSHLYQEGIIAPKKTDFRRNTARLSVSAELSPKVNINANAIYTYLDRDSVNENGLGSVLFNALNLPPTLTPFDQNGDFTLAPINGLGIEIINPLAQIDNTFNDYDLKKLNGTVGMDYQMFESLKISGRIGFNTANSEGRTFAKEVNYGGNKVFNVARSNVSQNAINDNDYSLDLFTNYNKSFNEAHNIDFLLGTTVFKTWGNGLYATGYDVPNNDWAFADISLAQGFVEGSSVDSYSYDERRLSFFTRVQYDYKGKYLLSAMLRRDASSKFGPGKKVGYFPSATLGWVVSDESFFGNPDFFDFFKIRASYGILGNDQIDNNLYLPLLGGESTYIFDGTLVNGTANGVLANSDLQWEEAKKFDVGVDFRFFNNKVDITADYFIDKRDNLLIPGISVSGISGILAPGAGAPTINAGAVENKGFEFAIGYQENFGNDFKMKVNYNVTTLKNKVLEVNNSTGYIEGGNFGVGQPFAARMQVGQPIGYFYGYQTDGIFQNQDEVNAHPSQSALGANASPGDIRYTDLNGDGVLDSDDRTNLGDPIPDVTMGFNINLNYKNFDFVGYVFASIGNEMIRNYERTSSDVNRLNYVLDRWTGEGTSNTVPRLTTAATSNNVLSSYFVEDASYVRIQNIQLGYTLPQTLLDKAGFTKIRLYTGINNLYTFTKYKGYDPGASNGNPIGGGIDFGFYPIPRTYIMGLNVNF